MLIDRIPFQPVLGLSELSLLGPINQLGAAQSTDVHSEKSTWLNVLIDSRQRCFWIVKNVFSRFVIVSDRSDSRSCLNKFSIAACMVDLTVQPNLAARLCSIEVSWK